MSNAQNIGDNLQNPYGSPQDPYGAPRKKGSLMWLWILLGILGGGGVAACACCFGGGYFAMGFSATIIAKSVEDNPVIEEHIGTIDSANFNFVKTGELGEEAPQGKLKPIALDVKGSKGSGTIEGYFNQTNNNIESGTLTTADGQTFDLFPAEAHEMPAP